MKNKLIFVCCACLAFASSAVAQPFERVLRRNFWNSGSNVAGLRGDDISFSNAELASSYESGPWRDSYMSASEWNVGLEAKTISHLDKFSMIGSFGFCDREAYDMAGSMFVSPGKFPVDVLEFSPGRKTFQDYSLMGGISVDLSPSWRIGGKLDFRAFNASKRKDLRYSSFNLDMTFAPSLQYHSGDLALGASIIYKRSTETIKAEQIGKAEAAPFAFFDEGLMIGNHQVWTGSGTRLSEAGVSGLPLQRNALGAGLQAQFGDFFAELDAASVRGDAGERQVIWYRFSGFESSALLGYRFGSHALRASASWERLSNRKTSFDKVTSGGITTVREYGSIPVKASSDFSARLEYEYLSPAFELRAAPSFALEQTLSTPLYPFVYARELKLLGFDSEALLRLKDLEFRLGLGFSKGFSSEDGRTLVETEAPEPFRLADYYAVALEYRTAAKLSAKLAIRYTLDSGIYFEARGKFANAFGIRYISGPLRYSAGLAFGYNFK